MASLSEKIVELKTLVDQEVTPVAGPEKRVLVLVLDILGDVVLDIRRIADALNRPH